MTDAFIHPAALVETTSIGEGTRIWAFAHIMPHVAIGRQCNIGDHAFVETGAVIGNNVTIKNQVSVWEGIRIEDDVFIGPHVAFVNDLYPRSPRMSSQQARYQDKQSWLVSTVVERGCSIGANATVLGGLRLGRHSLIAAGSTVTADVLPHSLVLGSPARHVAWICFCGQKLQEQRLPQVCPACGDRMATE